MDNDIQEKRKRTRKSRERRSTRGATKTKYDNEPNINNDQNFHLPSAPPLNHINQPHYGKIIRNI